MNTEAEKQRILNPKRHADPDDVIEADYEAAYKLVADFAPDIQQYMLEFAEAWKLYVRHMPESTRGNLTSLVESKAKPLIQLSDDLEASVIDAATQRMREQGKLD